MALDAAPWGLILAPVCLVAAAVYVLPPLLPMQRRWARLLVAGVVWTMAARYLHWRITQTLVLDAGWPAAAWSLFCLGVELLALADAAILFLAFTRVSDRIPEADAHEARLRTAPAADAPRVDVYIPTYNEPVAVLEKTILGALSIEWPNLAVYVLDDGRRAWLRDLCAEKGVAYITRPDNAGAKAGNINHALQLTDGEFVAVFDADFIPQRSFLMRTLGFFEDPKVGIVQVPHAFYNHDPMQTNLAMRRSLPDDQAFFFEAIMPSRDGWDAAFCCGSNSVTRRAALRSIGDALPDGSITEDMLLSLAMLRKGYVTRFLNEKLAYGLAPESVAAFFIQRQRWARGATQLLFLRSGPLGPGLKLAHRLLFMPTHWLTHSLMTLMSLIAPLVFLLCDLAPMTHTTTEACVYYLAPMLLAMFGGLTTFASGRYNPLAAQVLGTFQSFKLLPSVLLTLVKPRGHAFKVTPKGASASGGFERAVFLACLALIALNVMGLTVNVLPEWRRVDDVALVPMVAFWCGVNIVVLFLVSLICLQMPVRRDEERWVLQEPVMVRHCDNGAHVTLMSEDMSISGAGLRIGAASVAGWRAGDAVQAYVSAVGWTRARVARIAGDFVALKFEYGDGLSRDLMIRKLFTGGQNTAVARTSSARVTFALLKRIWSADMQVRHAPAAEPEAEAPAERLAPATRLLRPSPEAARLAETLERASRVA
jgi:cellulose synthase (UDP-forming)